MFRREPNIPQEPVIPIAEQILEDVLNSPDADVLFHLLDSDIGQESVSSSKTNITFEKVQAFVKLQEDLKLCIQQVKDKSESLKISECELKAMAEDIKKQSIQALQ